MEFKLKNKTAVATKGNWGNRDMEGAEEKSF